MRQSDWLIGECRVVDRREKIGPKGGGHLVMIMVIYLFSCVSEAIQPEEMP